MKKQLWIITILIICLVCFGAETLAYFTTSSRAHNIITSDAVKISVVEWQQTQEGIVPYPEAPVPVMPGRKISKIVQVRNHSAESYIRAHLVVTITDTDGKSRVLTIEETDQILHLDWNTDIWLQKKDDRLWWYYDQPVGKNATTGPLFSEVQFDGDAMDNAYENCTVNIQIIAQAVQTANNNGSVFTAIGWPDE